MKFLKKEEIFIIAMTSTKSWQSYETLCNVLERNDIDYERNDENLCVKCSVSGKDIQLNFLFVIHPSKMLVSLYSPVPVKIKRENFSNMALAVCIINNGLTDGNFCFEPSDGTVFFKMTSSFCDTNVSEELFEYMLSVAADTMDDYFLKISQIAKSEKPFEEDDGTAANLADFFSQQN